MSVICGNSIEMNLLMNSPPHEKKIQSKKAHNVLSKTEYDMKYAE